MRASIVLIVLSLAIGAALLSSMRWTVADLATGLASAGELDGHVSAILIAMGVAGLAFFAGLALIATDMFTKWHRKRLQHVAPIAGRQATDLDAIHAQADASRAMVRHAKPPGSK